MRYYEIARLTQGVSIDLFDDLLRVDLDKLTPQDSITNDMEFLAAQGKGVYFYLSGGGTLLINGRYMPVVRRPASAKIHPEKYSLFTGRAEGLTEWQNPTSVIRELFEELRVYKDGTLLVPKCPEFQEIIDNVYSANTVINKPLELAHIPLHNKKLQVKYKGKESSLDGFLYIGANGDINLLFVFAAEIALGGLKICDGESLNSGGGREVFLLDIASWDLKKYLVKAQVKC